VGVGLSTVALLVVGALTLVLAINYFPPAPVLTERSSVSNDAALPHTKDTNRRGAGRRLVSILEYVIVPVLLYSVFYPNSIDYPLDFYHEGERLAPANEMLHGGIPYRDIYIQHGVLQNAIVPFLGTRFFGTSLEGVRTVARMLEPLAFIALYLFGLQIFRGRVITALLPVLIVGGIGRWLSGRDLFGLLALVFVSCWIRSSGSARSLLLFFAGAASAFALCYSLDIGLYTIVGLTLFFACSHFVMPSRGPRESCTTLLSYAAGVALVFLPGVLLLLYFDSFSAFVENVRIQLSYQSQVWGFAAPSLSSLIEPLTTKGIVAGWSELLRTKSSEWIVSYLTFPLVSSYVTYRALCRRRFQSENISILLLLLFVGALYFRTALGRSDTPHLLLGGFYVWVILIFIFDRALFSLVDAWRNREGSQQSRSYRMLRQLPLVFLIGGFLWYLAVEHRFIDSIEWRKDLLSRYPYQLSERSDVSRLGRVKLPPGQEEQIQDVVSFIEQHTEEGEAIFDFSNHGAYYFFADRPSATRFHLITYAVTHDLQREIVFDLEKHQTKLVIFKTGSGWDALDGLSNEERQPLVAQYIREHFELAVDINATEIWLRKE